jgi:hypothetical protein
MGKAGGSKASFLAADDMGLTANGVEIFNPLEETSEIEG